MMSVCPICQSENLPNTRNCHYCGASLIDRRHRAPSRPAPALNTRPQLYHDPLADLDIATIPRTLPPKHFGATEQDNHFEGELITSSSTGGGALTIDEEVLNLESDADQWSFEDHNSMEAITPRKLGGAELTIDEAADGLGMIDLHVSSPEFSFVEQAPVQTKRLKLVDLGGDELESLPQLYDDEPRFGDPGSLTRQRELIKAQEEALDLKTGSSSLTKLMSIAIAFTVCIGLIWSLDLIPVFSTTESNSYLNPDLKEVNRNLSSTTRAVILKTEKSEVNPSQTTQSVTSSDHEVSSSQSAQTHITDESVQKETVSRQRKRQRKARSRSQSNLQNSSSSSQSFQTLISQGEQKLTQGRVNDAQKLFKKAQELKPSSPVPVAQLGWCELSSRRYQSAVGHFKRALTLSPGHGDSLYGLGYSYEKLNKIEDARRYFEDYLKRYPHGVKAKIIERKLSRL